MSMKKIFFVFAGLLFSILLQAQNVGIGIAVPNAKLDIAASNAAAPTNQDGLLVPRVDVFSGKQPCSKSKRNVALFNHNSRRQPARLLLLG